MRVHCSGQVLSHPTTGEVYLVLFEKSHTASPKRLLPLHRVLGKLENRLTILILDTPIIRRPYQDGTISIKWTNGLPLSPQEGTNIIQVRHKKRQNNAVPAKLLAWFSGKADANGNETTTVEEFLEDLEPLAEITSSLPKNSPTLLIPLVQ